MLRFENFSQYRPHLGIVVIILTDSLFSPLRTDPPLSMNYARLNNFLNFVVMSRMDFHLKEDENLLSASVEVTRREDWKASFCDQ